MARVQLQAQQLNVRQHAATATATAAAMIHNSKTQQAAETLKMVLAATAFATPTPAHILISRICCKASNLMHLKSFR